MKLLFLALAIFSFSSCLPVDPQPDQQVRQRIFMECLKAVPAGPARTTYNDWAEVVSECGVQAYQQSLVLQ